jgi:hypothetical protein
MSVAWCAAAGPRDQARATGPVSLAERDRLVAEPIATESD